MSLAQLMDFLFALFAARNSVHLPSLDLRIAFLALGVRNLEQAFRKGREKEYAEALASVFARTCSVAEVLRPRKQSGTFRSSFVAMAMATKYPCSECAYCHHLPCDCPERRKEPELLEPKPEQLAWSLRQWQDHLRQVYGERNAAAGVPFAFNRLYSEVAELMALRFQPSGVTASDMIIQYTLELADTYARIIAVANLLGIDLERVVRSRYEHGCHTCHQSPCDCPPFTISMRAKD